MSTLLKRGSAGYILPLGALYLSSQLQSDDPFTLLAVRVCSAAAVALHGACLGLVYARLSARRDDTELTYADPSAKPPKRKKRAASERDASGAGEASGKSAAEEATEAVAAAPSATHVRATAIERAPDGRPLIRTTVHEYDMGVLRKEATTWFVGAIMTGVLGFWIAMFLPLVIAVSQSLAAVLDSPIIALHVFHATPAGDLTRPFGEPPGLLDSIKGEWNSLKKEMSDAPAPAADGRPSSATEAADAFRRRFGGKPGK